MLKRRGVSGSYETWMVWRGEGGSGSCETWMVWRGEGVVGVTKHEWFEEERG